MSLPVHDTDVCVRGYAAPSCHILIVAAYEKCKFAVFAVSFVFATADVDGAVPLSAVENQTARWKLMTVRHIHSNHCPESLRHSFAAASFAVLDAVVNEAKTFSSASSLLMTA